MTCDLHAHSYFSDGTDSPEELIENAKKVGLDVLALTDHNTTKGLSRFVAAANERGIKAVPGVEFSTDYKETELHILGLFIKDEYFAEIEDMLAPMMKRKVAANDELVRRLIDDGYYIDYDKIKKEAGGEINRAHIACELVDRGYVKDRAEAFKTLLKKNGKYYTVVKRIDAFEIISYIKSIGGAAVLAHPAIELTEAELREFLPLAKASGLDAIEVYYQKFDEATVKMLEGLAEEYGLLASGGSDYHGWRKPGVLLGNGNGDKHIDCEIYERLKERQRI